MEFSTPIEVSMGGGWAAIGWDVKKIKKFSTNAVERKKGQIEEVGENKINNFNFG